MFPGLYHGIMHLSARLYLSCNMLDSSLSPIAGPAQLVHRSGIGQYQMMFTITTSNIHGSHEVQ